jgi:hypothetical protein
LRGTEVSKEWFKFQPVSPFLFLNVVTLFDYHLPPQKWDLKTAVLWRGGHGRPILAFSGMRSMVKGLAKNSIPAGGTTLSPTGWQVKKQNLERISQESKESKKILADVRPKTWVKKGK